MTTTAEKIETLRRRVVALEQIEREAVRALHEAEADLAEAEGNEDEAEFHRAYVATFGHDPAAHERFAHICRVRAARRILAGVSSLDDEPGYARAKVEAEIKRLAPSRDLAAQCGE